MYIVVDILVDTIEVAVVGTVALVVLVIIVSLSSSSELVLSSIVGSSPVSGLGRLL